MGPQRPHDLLVAFAFGLALEFVTDLAIFGYELWEMAGDVHMLPFTMEYRSALQ